MTIVRETPIEDMTEEQCREIATVLHTKYVARYPYFKLTVGELMGLVVDSWLITSGRIPLKFWMEEE